MTKYVKCVWKSQQSCNTFDLAEGSSAKTHSSSFIPSLPHPPIRYALMVHLKSLISPMGIEIVCKHTEAEWHTKIVCKHTKEKWHPTIDVIHSNEARAFFRCQPPNVLPHCHSLYGRSCHSNDQQIQTQRVPNNHKLFTHNFSRCIYIWQLIKI